MRHSISQPVIYLGIGIGAVAFFAAQYMGPETASVAGGGDVLEMLNEPEGQTDSPQTTDHRSSEKGPRITTEDLIEKGWIAKDQNSPESNAATNPRLALETDTINTIDLPPEPVHSESEFEQAEDSTFIAAGDANRYQLDNASPEPTGTADSAFEQIDDSSTMITGLPKSENSPVAGNAEGAANPFQNMNGTRITNSAASAGNSSRWKSNPYINAAVPPKPASPPIFDGTGGDGEFENDFISDAGESNGSLISSDTDQDQTELSQVVNLESATASISENAASVVEELATAAAPTPQSTTPQLATATAHKAVHRIEYGKSLARRGASHAARQEFYAALRILAQSYDSQLHTNTHTQSLRSAILAIQEAEDFIVKDTQSQIGLDVGSVIEGHTTKVVSPSDASSMTPIDAMQRYFSFASEQLLQAGSTNVVAAEALFCLGKLHAVEAKFNPNPSKLDIAKAMVFHQAAIASDQRNYRALNELGVLFANSGRFLESQQMFKRSLSIYQMPQTWKNLSVAHKRLGEHRLAELANQEFVILSQRPPATPESESINWFNADAFNENAPLPQSRVATQNGTPIPAKPSIGQRLKKLF